MPAKGAIVINKEIRGIKYYEVPIFQDILFLRTFNPNPT